MEIFNLYTSVSSTWGYMNFMRHSVDEYPYPVLDWKILIVSLCIAVAVWTIFFILQGIGIYRQAKAQGLSKKGRAYLPFVNLLLIEKLSGECRVFGQRMRHAGLWTMIVEIVCFLTSAVLVFCEVYLYAAVGAPQNVGTGVLIWMDLQGVARSIYTTYQIFSYVLPIAQLVCEVLLFILFLGYFRRLKPRNAGLFAVIVLFLPLARYLLVFIFRNAPVINYEEYVRMQREEFERRYGAYGNPYGNPSQPNSMQNERDSSRTEHAPVEEPFSEFDTNSNMEEDSSSGKSGDDWFN